MNRVDVFRLPTPETTINLLFFFFLFSDNISMGSTNGEADAAADTAAPKYFGKRRGGKPGPTMSDVINRVREKTRPLTQTAQQQQHIPSY